MGDLYQKADGLASQGLRDLHRLVSSANGMLAAVQDATAKSIEGSSTEAIDSAKSNISAGQAAYVQARESLQKVLTECVELQKEIEKRRQAPEVEDPVERERLLSEVKQMREEATRKNEVVKGLIDETRALLGDMTMMRLAKIKSTSQ
mmetsp:Transcript_39062/g.84983  ORF Transcript_39062/g.84983 Transcript_39062/m.84983 type:complete len:148 (-) Transcript_39062:220-663(-)|eukprot:CAMPEP_0118926826 /NCGR_PEP_ID=MMETSP1169-20130426/4441_1 /TAXON_ID=36882 /ORGANISM="Pyramimonas obovata, Strain CCMP722" /LENGTH=147 /DNA_ID=CAMNT_0006868459 /DNA_START=98 /DNA_END=541 /DNA_ORIENTATION=+